MPHRHVDVIGGGAAGLYAARLLKISRPGWSVTVHERMHGSGETFGFGVVLTESTMDNLVRADPASAADIRSVSHSGHALHMRRGGDQIDLHGARNLAIGRNTLLEVLAAHARDAGVNVVTGSQTEASECNGDIVIAADGVRSKTREKLATELGAEVSLGRGLYLWCGTDFALDDSMFSPARTEHGLFVTHAYPYAPDRSTFLIETDEASWRAAGMDQSDAAITDGTSDEYSLDYLQHAFAEELHGHRLLGNRSRWQRFRTVHLDRWSYGNTILIGDAAHTAHYTLGSGTKLALEDAIALTDNLLAEDHIASAFARYEQQRRPAVERFQRLAARSQRWWESFPQRIEQPMARLATGFMTRAGNIDLDRLVTHADELLLQALHCYSTTAGNALPDDIIDWVLDQPWSNGTTSVSARVIDDMTMLDSVTDITWSQPDPFSADADAVLTKALREPGAVVRLRGDDHLTAVQGRIDLGERLRLEHSIPVLVDLPAGTRAEAAAGLLCGRCDLVHFTP